MLNFINYYCCEQGGDPRSIDFCNRIGLDYVSCSPYRVPFTMLAVAHTTFNNMSNAHTIRNCDTIILNSDFAILIFHLSQILFYL